MKALLHLLFLTICIQIGVSAQTSNTHSDTLYYRSLISKYKIKIDSTIAVNKNGHQLNLSKRDAIRIARIVLKSSFSKTDIRSERPFTINKYLYFWIILGREQKGYGGRMILFLNSKNGTVELLIVEK